MAPVTDASSPSSFSAASKARCTRFWPYTRSYAAARAALRTRLESSGESSAQIASR